MITMTTTMMIVALAQNIFGVTNVDLSLPNCIGEVCVAFDWVLSLSKCARTESQK